MAANIMAVQHYPATGDYIVHRVDRGVETYMSADDIKDKDVHDYLSDCVDNNLYHVCTIHLHTGKVDGPKTLPVKQITYCKFFETNEEGKQAKKTTAISWVLWEPHKYELTVNRGWILGSNTLRIRDLNDAPEDVIEFMRMCASGDNIALCRHYSKPDKTGKVARMVNVSEYFFSVGKLIYGFSGGKVADISAEEIKGMGLI